MLKLIGLPRFLNNIITQQIHIAELLGFIDHTIKECNQKRIYNCNFIILDYV